MEKNVFGKAVLEGGIEALIISFFHSFGKAAEAKGIEFLKSKMFGIGTNDEHLFLSAAAYAADMGWVTLDQLVKIYEVIGSYPESQRNRIVGTIGKEEEDVITQSPKLDPVTKEQVKDKKGQVVMEKTSFRANIKGAKMLGLLGKLEKDQIKEFLRTSGASAKFMDGVTEEIRNTSRKVENSKIKKDGDLLFAKETWLEKKARELKEKEMKKKMGIR